jgi:hypothetical protein
LSIFGLRIGPKLLINATTLTPAVANWPHKFDGILFSALGPIQGHNVKHLLVTWGNLKSSFPISALIPNVKALGADFNFCPYS